MPITFIKYNGPKKLRNGSTNTLYYTGNKVYNSVSSGGSDNYYSGGSGDSVFSKYFTFDSSNNAVKCLYPFYTDSWSSAGGANPDTSSGGSSTAITVHPWADITDNFNDSDLTSTFNAYTIKKIYSLIQNSGGSALTYDDIIDGLGYIPADASAVVESLTASDISTALGYIPADASAVVHSLGASDISTALGFIPYNAANPNGYLNSGDFKTINGETIYGSGNISITFDTAALSGVTEDITDLSTRIATNTSNIATNASNIATNASNIATNTNNIADLSANIASFTSSYSNLNNQITAIGNQVSTNTNNIYDLSTKINNTTGNISDISARVLANTNKINDVSARVYSLENNPL